MPYQVLQTEQLHFRLLVLDYLKHPDLSQDLAALCRKKGIPVIASGKKIKGEGAYCPKTCCGLSRNKRLGAYNEVFGAPEYEVEVADGKIARIEILRGAPCSATWDAALRVIGLPVEEAISRIGLETQFVCSADPSSWDPIYGHNPVHIAGDIHSAALEKAVRKAQAK